jgi:integrase
VGVRRRPEPVTPAELATALRATGEPWLTTIMLGVGAGLRASEMAAIRREDITEEYVHVRCGKGGKERFVDTCGALWAFVQDRPAGFLVRRPDGRPVTGAWLSSKQSLHWRSIGLPGWHLHRLRHTFCTTMWQAGNDPLVVRDLMGHASVATTQGYAQAARGAYRQAVATIDALLREHQPDGSRLVPAAA